MEKVLFTRQRHEADRAGLHWDYRLVVGGKAHSWATKKQLPEPGESIMLWQQPVHTVEYALAKRVVIPKGQYGSGITTLDWVKKGDAEIGKDKIVINTSDGKFLLKKMPGYAKGDGWLFKNLGKEKDMEKKAFLHLLSKVHQIANNYKNDTVDISIPREKALELGLTTEKDIKHNFPLVGFNLSKKRARELGLLEKESCELIAEDHGKYVPTDVQDITYRLTGSTTNRYLNKIAEHRTRSQSALKGAGYGALAGGAVAAGSLIPFVPLMAFAHALTERKAAYPILAGKILAHTALPAIAGGGLIGAGLGAALHKNASDLAIAKKSHGEEEKAIHDYGVREKEVKNPVLEKALKHARGEEKDHAKLFEKAEKDIEKKSALSTLVTKAKRVLSAPGRAAKYEDIVDQRSKTKIQREMSAKADEIMRSLRPEQKNYTTAAK